MQRTCSLACLGLFVWTAAVAAQKTTPAAASDTVVSTSARPMLAVARMLVEDTWTPILDERIQQSPAAKSVGAAWKPADPRWQKARAALGARMTRLFDAYAKSPEMANKVREEIGKIGAGPNLDAAIAALKGPAGPAIIRQQAQMTYVVLASTAGGPNRPGPEIGSAEWNAQLRDMQRRFAERAGSDIPAEDAARKADVEKLFAAREVREVLRRVFDAGVSTGQRQMNTGLNLMVFDEQQAIERDVAAAIGGSAPSIASTAAAPAAVFPLEQMATCQDSWLDWKDDPVSSASHRDGFRAQFQQRDGDAFFTPIGKVTMMGLPVTRVYSNTVGMGVGFSVMVDAPFAKAKAGVEKSLGKPLKKCETGEGMRTCELSIAEKKTVMLLADATGKLTSTLIGCFYYYEK